MHLVKVSCIYDRTLSKGHGDIEGEIPRPKVRWAHGNGVWLWLKDIMCVVKRTNVNLIRGVPYFYPTQGSRFPKSM